MIAKKLDEIYSLTAQATGHPKKVVEHAVKSQFRFLQQWILSEDKEKPAVLLQDLGRVELHLAVITGDLKSFVIPMLRKDRDNPKLLERFRKLWKYRKLVLNYLLDKRRKKRHDWREEKRQYENNGGK